MVLLRGSTSLYGWPLLVPILSTWLYYWVLQVSLGSALSFPCLQDLSGNITDDPQSSFIRLITKMKGFYICETNHSTSFLKKYNRVSFNFNWRMFSVFWLPCANCFILYLLNNHFMDNMKLLCISYIIILMNNLSLLKKISLYHKLFTDLVRKCWEKSLF
jgi:hypothetical protein